MLKMLQNMAKNRNENKKKKYKKTECLQNCQLCVFNFNFKKSKLHYRIKFMNKKVVSIHT